jgi:16S rRNA (cytidine1402-2'-O)-methyltransferase
MALAGHQPVSIMAPSALRLANRNYFSVPFRHSVGKSAPEGHASARGEYELNPMATPDHTKTATKTQTTMVRPTRHYRVFARDVEAARPAPGLYLVATPIGNLGDVTLRALEILAGVDVVACEDTRVTHRLFDRYGLTTPLIAYHDHNAAAARPKLLARLDAGDAVALVSDAGTPLISDPGFKLVREAQAAGHMVTAVPGASAVMAAVASAGLPTDRFFFEGFLPPREQARRARLAELVDVPATLVFFETGPRIAAMLSDVAAAFGDREAAVCRELTKLHEEIRRADLVALARAYDDESAETRGEFVVVVGPPAAEAPVEAEDLDALLRQALATESLKNAVEAVVAATGHKRRLVYQRALSLTRSEADGER